MGQEPGREGAEGVREVAKEKTGSKVLKVVGTGKLEKNFAASHSIIVM